jgi:predicted ATPase
VLQPLDDAAALQLFLQRAAAAGAAPLAPDDADRYTAICRRLDRLPLAIELIAVRARAHTPDELLQLLDRSLLALADGPRDAAPRHQSLRHVIRWSYDLLADDEQRVFRALGAFVGGCTPEALQAVAGPEVEVGPAVEGLLRASLVQRQEVAGQSRLLLLETIREFALEQLAQRDEAALARRRHAEQLAGFAMAAYQELLRPDAPRWVAWVAAEQANLRAAFRWARANGQHATALRLATGVWRFHYHYSQGSTRAGLEQLEEALADREQAPLELQCHALRAAGTLAGGLNDYARARRWLEDAVAVGWRLGDTRALQMALTNFGYALLEQGELEDARVHLEVSLSLAQRGAEPWTAKFPLGLLAGLHQRLGELEQAQALSEEGLRLNRERQDPEGTADALRTLGRILLARGELDRARQLGEQALAAHGAIGHHHGMGLDHALLGDAARARGDGPAALAHYRRCLALWWEREHLVATAAVLDSVAELLSRHGAAARAATLLGSAASLRARTEARLTPAEQAACDRTLAACRAALGEPACADAWAAGRGLTLRQAMALALEPEPVAGTP